MQAVSLLIKPASGQCNLRCRYCFYRELMSHGAPADHRMTRETLEAVVRRAFETGARQISFAFQGGEPMLAGLDFFREFIQLERRYARPGTVCEHSIQTNGTLITPQWAAFFKENDFLVGISLDGTAALHDANRVDVNGAGSFAAAERGAALLQQAGVECNALCVVTGELAKRPQQVYEGLKQMGFSYLQFIPCLDALGAERGTNPYSLTPNDYAPFLKAVFDLWYRDWEAEQYVSVRQFDDYVHLLAGLPASSCSASGWCGQYLVVEADGSTYPCDFYVLEQTRTGNVNDLEFAQILASDAQRRFEQSGHLRPGECAFCEYAAACGAGGCRRDHVFDPEGNPHNYFCPAYREFFAYAMPRLLEIAEMERQMRRMFLC